jgi:hypothetical protein
MNPVKPSNDPKLTPESKRLLLKVEAEVEKLYPRYFWIQENRPGYCRSYTLVNSFMIFITDTGKLVYCDRFEFETELESWLESEQGVPVLLNTLKKVAFINDLVLDNGDLKAKLSNSKKDFAILTDAITDTAPHLDGVDVKVLASHIRSLPHTENRFYMTRIQSKHRKLKRSDSL